MEIKNVDFNTMDSREVDYVIDVMLDMVTQAELDKINDICGEKTEILYQSWMLLHGVELTNKWVEDRGGSIVGYDGIVEFSRAIIGNFIEWLETCNH